MHRKRQGGGFIMPKPVQKMRDLDTNPCIEETDASSKCMINNNHQKDLCGSYFLKYKNCKKYWNGIVSQRRREGVKPCMPTAEERKNMMNAMGGIPY